MLLHVLHHVLLCAEGKEVRGGEEGRRRGERRGGGKEEEEERGERKRKRKEAKDDAGLTETHARTQACTHTQHIHTHTY